MEVFLSKNLVKSSVKDRKLLDSYQYSPEPFRHWVIDGFFPSRLLETFIVSLEGIKWEVSYDNDCERGKRTSRPPFPDHWQMLAAYLTSYTTLSQLECLTNTQLHIDPDWYGAGLHVTKPGGHLTCHLDYALHPKLKMERRINLVWFANPVWKFSWGGAFELWDSAARNIIKKVYPAFNRAVIWEAGDTSYHGTEVMSKEASERITLTSYYLSQPREGCVRQRALYVPNRDPR